jgi:hypothetical protein
LIFELKEFIPTNYHSSKGKNIMNTVIQRSTTPWFMLFSRLLLFASIQSIFALAFYLAGSSNSWETSANWWPMVVVITKLVCARLLVQIFQLKGKRYWDIFRFDRQHIKGDLLVLLSITVLTAPIPVLPNNILGG